MTDRSGETSRFDPRFDPAFQPGYDVAARRQGQRSDDGPSGQGIAEAAAAALSDQRGAEQRSADLRNADQHAADYRSADYRSAEQRSVDFAAGGRTGNPANAEQRSAGSRSGSTPSGFGPRPPGPPLPYTQTETGLDASGRLDLEDPDAAPAARSANPFLLVLWVASALMVFGGVGLYQWVGQLTAEAQRTGSAPYDYFLVQSLIFGAPLLMVLGVATATGILFVHAVRWRKRR